MDLSNKYDLYKTMLLKQFISPVYWNLIPEVLDLEIPEEKFASCNDCHYCQNPSEPKSLTKCCEYYPTIPNYMVDEKGIRKATILRSNFSIKTLSLVEIGFLNKVAN